MKKPFNVVFEDDYLVVVNKIAKLLVQPSPKREKITLTSLLSRDLNIKALPCHRLDRETSGLIIYAKSSDIQRKVMEQFKQAKVKKKYFAFVKGEIAKQKGLLEGFILDREGQRFSEKAKKAKTFYRAKARFNQFSFLELEPLTGRTNQLRIQLADIGHPILGESKYAFRRDFPLKFKRLALHAYFLSFLHPYSNDRLHLEVKLASDMALFLDQARKAD
tara:strand:- start:116 stop:772 length:657 start_codon:yes stop_codon:yes gene_type:complete